MLKIHSHSSTSVYMFFSIVVLLRNSLAVDYYRKLLSRVQVDCYNFKIDSVIQDFHKKIFKYGAIFLKN